MSMKLILLGPPGAGKGTNAARIGERHQLRHLATGDILRAHIKKGSALGKKAKDIIERGSLVPDDLVNEMMKEEIKRAGLDKGFILDGYPRTLVQAEALDAFLKNEGVRLDAVLNFVTSEHVIIERLSGRRICPQCAANYHIRNIPPKKEGICDACGAELVQRKDDNPEAIRHRLEVYEKETSPLIEYYTKAGSLHNVLADSSVDEVQEELKGFFDKLGLRR